MYPLKWRWCAPPNEGLKLPGGVVPMDEKRQVLRHFLVALAYRTPKALRAAPRGIRRPPCEQMESGLRPDGFVT